jgi:hypothetical protein
MIDFNAANESASDFNKTVNELLNAAALAEEREARRNYLGASSIGSECLRKIQYDWRFDSVFPARTKRIFARGHLFEEISVKALGQAGFRMERHTPATEFSAAGGNFKGHADGIIVAAPESSGLKIPCLWEHKALGDAGWKKIEKYGLKQAYPVYYDQCQLYMAYLGLDANPAVFSAVNANTCEMLHVLVPYNGAAAQAASDRAVTVIKATQAGELLDRIAKAAEDWRCKMCSHKERCWE